MTLTGHGSLVDTPFGMYPNKNNGFIALSTPKWNAAGDTMEESGSTNLVLSNKPGYTGNKIESADGLTVRSKEGTLRLRSPYINIDTNDKDITTTQHVSFAPFFKGEQDTATNSVNYFYPRVTNPEAFDEDTEGTYVSELNAIRVGLDRSNDRANDPKIKKKVGIFLSGSLAANTWTGATEENATSIGIQTALNGQGDTNVFNIYSNGTAPSWHQGNVFIGGNTNDLGTSTAINLLSNGSATFTGQVNLPGGGTGNQAVTRTELDTALEGVAGGGGGGTITGVTAGSGLSGGGTSGTVTLNVDTTTIATQTYVDDAVADLATEGYVDNAVSDLATEGYVDNAVSDLATEAYVDDAIAAITPPEEVYTRSVLEFGVTGDNADCTVQLQAALDWLAGEVTTNTSYNTGGKCLYFPAGRYRSKQPLIFDPINRDAGGNALGIQNNITIKGEGPATVIIGNHTGTVLDINPNAVDGEDGSTAPKNQLTNVTIEDICFASSHLNNVYTSAGLKISRAYAVNVTNVDCTYTAQPFVFNRVLHSVMNACEARCGHLTDTSDKGIALIRLIDCVGIHIDNFEGMGPDQSPDANGNPTNTDKYVPDYGIYTTHH